MNDTNTEVTSEDIVKDESVVSDTPSYKRKNVTTGQRARTPRTLNDIMGYGNRTVYKTSNQDEYKKYLKSLNSSDLFAHAIDVGIQPSQHRQSLESKLLKEFKVKNSSFGAVISDDQVNQNNSLEKEKRQKALRILSVGK